MNRTHSSSSAPTQHLLGLLKRLSPYSNGVGKYLWVVLLTVIVAALTEPLIPALFKPLLDRGFVGNRLPIWMVPVFIIGIFALRGLASFIGKYGTNAVSYTLIERIAKQQFAMLHKAHPTLYTQHTASSLVNTLIHELQTGCNLLAGSLLALVKDVAAAIALLAYLVYLNWQLTLIALIVGPLMAWVIGLLSKRLHRITQRSQNTTDQLAYAIEENVLAWRTVRLHQAQAAQQMRFASLIEQLKKLQVKSTVAQAAVMPATQILAACAISAVVCAALWQNSTSGVTVGGFVAFITAMLMLIAPLRGISEQMGTLTRASAALERNLDLLENTSQEQSGSSQAPAYAPLDLHFQDVSLRYGNAPKDALSHIDLRIPAGRTFALVGSSGSGKTTLVNLLPRFLEPSSGKITLAGLSIQDWSIQALREQFSFVSQDVVMFEGTVAQNIALGNLPDEPLDRLRIQAAIDAAYLSDVVAQLPHGMDTALGHNANTLSGGQRQRLAIARALYKNAPIVVLDEATSALDNESEQAVKDALKHLSLGRTTIIIAHRLSTIEHADEIVVLQEGRVIERGNHQDLLSLKGSYFRMQNVQAQLSRSTGEV